MLFNLAQLSALSLEQKKHTPCSHICILYCLWHME